MSQIRVPATARPVATVGWFSALVVFAMACAQPPPVQSARSQSPESSAASTTASRPAPESSPSSAPPSAPADPRVERGRALWSAFWARDFDAFLAPAADSLRSAFDRRFASRLLDRYDVLLGRPTGTDPGTAELQEDIVTIRIPVRLERGTLTARLAFDAHDRLLGMWLDDAMRNDVLREPPYANRTAFRDQQVTVRTASDEFSAWISLPRQRARYAAVVLLTGPEPWNADAAVSAAAWPMRDLAWGLASNGVAAVRFDNRAFRAFQRQSAAPAAPPEDLPATLAQAWLHDVAALLGTLRARRDIDPDRIVLLGHGTAGLAAMAAARSDPRVSGVALLATPAASALDALRTKAARTIHANQDVTPDEARQLEDLDLAIAALRAGRTPPSRAAWLGGMEPLWSALEAASATQLARQVGRPLWIGEAGRDFENPPADEARWRDALARDPLSAYHLYPPLNHWFSPSRVDGPLDYEAGGVLDESVVRDLAQWVRNLPPADAAGPESRPNDAAIPDSRPAGVP